MGFCLPFGGVDGGFLFLRWCRWDIGDGGVFVGGVGLGCCFGTGLVERFDEPGSGLFEESQDY